MVILIVQRPNNLRPPPKVKLHSISVDKSECSYNINMK